MSGPNDKAPSDSAPEALKKQSSDVVLADTASAGNSLLPDTETPLPVEEQQALCEFFEIAEELESEPEPQILWRLDDARNSVVRLPVHGPDRGGFQEHAILWYAPPDERVIAALPKLWARGLLPFYAPVIGVYVGRVEIGFDRPDPEPQWLADYQTRLDKIQWAFPWRLVAVRLAPGVVARAEAAGLGLRYRDEAPTGGVS
jgi:hypothetical protein